MLNFLRYSEVSHQIIPLSISSSKWRKHKRNNKRTLDLVYRPYMCPVYLLSGTHACLSTGSQALDLGKWDPGNEDTQKPTQFVLHKIGNVVHCRGKEKQKTSGFVCWYWIKSVKMSITASVITCPDHALNWSRQLKQKLQWPINPAKELSVQNWSFLKTNMLNKSLP